MKNETTKLDQLTSLRFFAAFMILIHHSGVFIGNINFNLDHGVTFFFVLSGFILTYVYPKLDTWLKIKLFMKARIARIWPAYFASFLLGIWLLPYGLDIKTMAAYLLMIQAWIPLSNYYFSYNAVGWSISTEFFFYIAFPVLVYKWQQTWLIKLLFSVTVLIGLIELSNYFSLPDYGQPGVGNDGKLLTQHGLLYINPLSRIFEFIYGMCIALVWGKKRSHFSFLSATSYEFGAIILCALSMYFTSPLAEWSSDTILGPSASQWLVHSGSVFAFGLLIYILAQGKGVISKVLQHHFLVLLGEISFSIYLIHKILIDYYASNIADFPALPRPIAFSVFLLILFLSSYLMWAWIEMPSRRLIMGNKKIHGTVVMKKSWRDHLALSRKSSFAFITLCIIALLIIMNRPLLA